LELTIEKLIYGGDGLARLPADEKGRGKAVFVPFTLPGEKVEASIEEEKPGFARALVRRIVQASPERIEAQCPYFQRCGGCHYQHTGYEQQLEIKAEVLKENLRRLAKMELSSELQVHASPPWNYRNRTRLQVRADSNFMLGYFKAGSHELLAVEACPISSPLLNRAIESLRRLGRAGKVPGELREIELFANDDDTRLQVEVFTDPRSAKVTKTQAQEFIQGLRAELPEVVSACVFAQNLVSAKIPALTSQRTRGEGGAPMQADWILGPGEFLYRTKAAPLRVSAGSFFQVNRFLVDELVSIVTGGRSGDVALDLYAGVGLFTVALATSFRHIVAVESSHGSAKDLKYNSPRNVKAVGSTVDEYLAGKAEKVRAELVVVDPPRAGLGERVARGLVKLGARRVIYVSCDPATLARDLSTLTAGGYRVERMHLVDLFPQTYHVETVIELLR
jgi:23S rRNA (uracil1939-C5)-methyltransferase